MSEGEDGAEEGGRGGKTGTKAGVPPDGGQAGADRLGDGGAAGGANAGAAGAAGATVGAQESGASIYVRWERANELEEQEFFDHPWPSDARLDESGYVGLSHFPNPRQSPLLDSIRSELERKLSGFSPVAAGYLRFTAALDVDTLPGDPLRSTSDQSSVQLIDVDPASAEFGQRRPLSWRFQAEPAVYIPSHTLSFMPALGYPLLPTTRYALVVTNRVRALDGGTIEAASELLEDLTDPPAGLEPALEGLSAARVELDSIVHLAAFTTSDPSLAARSLRDYVVDEYPAPENFSLAYAPDDSLAGSYATYLGSYGPSPDFQRGTPPFLSSDDGGSLAYDPPEVQRDLTLDFVLTVPDSETCSEPDGGYQVVITAHGTGADRRSILGVNREADVFAAHCMASFAIDQIFHGTRIGGGSGLEELLFFNFQNPAAGRSNAVQAALDLVQQARLVTGGILEIEADVSHRSEPIRFDPETLVFFGHSQGGLNGPIYLALDDSARGGALSGASGMLSITLLEKTQPIDIAALMRTTILSLEDEELGELDLFHPALSLAQTAVDPSDPIHYMPHIFSRPRAGMPAKSLLMTEGVNADGTGDSYAPPHGTEVLAVAAGLPPQSPVIHPILELDWGNLEPIAVPEAGLSGNLAEEAASGVLSQWPAAEASDGHFVLYEIPQAFAQTAGFLSSLAEHASGRVPPP